MNCAFGENSMSPLVDKSIVAANSIGANFAAANPATADCAAANGLVNL